MIEFAMVDFGDEERNAVNRVMQGTSLASGKENAAFEQEFAEYVGVKYAVCVNSGSSANLLAMASLNLPKGSYVMTSACGFPATLNPILHLGLKPLLVDYDTKTHNICLNDFIQELPKVKAVILAHTMGNPVEMEQIVYAAERLGIPIIEDCCEAVGAKVGTWGTLATWSFYPAHQMTALGGGGMVTTDDEALYRRMKSFRDWGKMYDWDSGVGGVVTDYNSPIKYHRGYTYETVGWNMKLPEANAAFGREQLKKLDSFRDIRIDNWEYLYHNLDDLEEIYISPMGDGACPFGFCMDVKFNRNEFGKFLEQNGIRHRPFFAGNILRQPAYLSEDAWRFRSADYLMKNTLFVGCHTKMTLDDLNHIIRKVTSYVSDHRNT